VSVQSAGRQRLTAWAPRSNWLGAEHARSDRRRRRGPRIRLRAALPILAVGWLLGATAACDAGAAVDVRHWMLSQGGRSEGGRSELVTLPERFDDRLSSASASYQLRTSVAVPAAWRGRGLSLSIIALPAVAQLYVAGQRVHSFRSWPSATYRDGPHIWRIPAAMTDVPELTLELRVVYKWSVAAWVGTVPRLGPGGGSERYARVAASFNRWTNLLAVGSIGTIAFTYVVLFLYVRNLAYFWLALQVIFPIYYLLFHLGVTQVVPVRFDATTMGLSISAAVVVGVQAAHVRFDLGPMAKIWWWLLGASALAMALGSRQFVSVMPYSIVVVATMGSGVAYVTFRLLREAIVRRDADLALDGVCWLFLVLSTPADGWFWIGGGELFGGLRLAAVGLLCFPLLQFVMLCRALQRQRLEIAELNRELRHQIAERSRQLEAALAKLRSTAPAVPSPGGRPTGEGAPHRKGAPHRGRKRKGAPHRGRKKTWE
jgi:hypothetical protein